MQETKNNECPFVGRMGQCPSGECFHKKHVDEYWDMGIKSIDVDPVFEDYPTSGGGFEVGLCVNCNEPLGTDGRCDQCDVPV